MMNLKGKKVIIFILGKNGIFKKSKKSRKNPKIRKKFKFLDENRKNLFNFSILLIFRLSKIDTKYLIIKGNELQAYGYFHGYRNYIREFFTCDYKVLNNVHEIANNLFKYS